MQVEQILKKRGVKGFSITELVEKSNLSRSKVRTELAKLEGAKKVSIREVGMAKVYSWKK